MQAVIISLISIVAAAPQSTAISSTDPTCQAFITAQLPQAVVACPGLDLSGSSAPSAQVICTASCQAFIGPFVTNGKSACQNDPINVAKLSLVQQYSGGACGSTSATTAAPTATSTPKASALNAGVGIGAVLVGAMAMVL
ncbi:hypothetical protein HDV01_002190 [Terramyces sp. JEL0728]|nr:hypothetical protein HDV01_002190 [Terramyces sp. JEL0728]